MASTYSITLSAKNTGYRAHNVFLPANEQIEDAYASPTAQANAMIDNTQVQIKRPDGSLRYVTIDASRSDPSKNLIFLLPV